MDREQINKELSRIWSNLSENIQRLPQTTIKFSKNSCAKGTLHDEPFMSFFVSLHYPKYEPLPTFITVFKRGGEWYFSISENNMKIIFSNGMLCEASVVGAAEALAKSLVYSTNLITGAPMTIVPFHCPIL